MPGIHHRDAVGDFVDHGQVVGDQQQCHAALALQAFKQRENLGLDGHVERGGRLVGNQHLGLARQRDRNHHALLEPAGKLMRVGIPASGRVRHAHFGEQGEAAFAHLLAAQFQMRGQRLADLLANRKHRVERAHRLLKHHADPRAAAFAHRGFGQTHQILAAEPYDAIEYPCGGLRRQSHQRECRHRLAAAGFAQQRQRFTGRDRETHVVDRAQQARRRVEMGA